MNHLPDNAVAVVPSEEIAQRIAEYRRIGFERKAMPHVVYHGAWVACPWPGCGFQIAGIDFQLETADPDRYASLLAAWWQGAGLVGRCPGCHQFVLFTNNDKQCISDPAARGVVVLPEDWFQRAFTI